MNLLLCLVLLFSSAQDNIIVSPNPAVAGKEITVSIPAASQGKVLTLASPFGAWQHEVRLTGQTSVKILVPKKVPLLLGAIFAQGDFESSFTMIPLVDRKGNLQENSEFWQAYLLGGFPAPFPVPLNQAEAIKLAELALKRDPGKLTNQELVWRLKAKEAVDSDKRDDFLYDVDAKLAAAPNGRLAIAAATVHLMLGDPQGANVINGAHGKLAAPVQKFFQGKWNDIVTTSSLARRTAKLLNWLEEDPFNSYGSRNVQILAATFSARNNYLNTARFGLLSLRILPDDAMTLNGVALAMAEGNFQLERGLLFAERAVSILNSAEKLKKPAQLSNKQWEKELLVARSAAIETKAWLLAKLKRYNLARQNFDLSAAMNPTDELYLHYGIMLNEQKKTTEARKYLRKGLKLNGPRKQEINFLLQSLGK